MFRRLAIVLALAGGCVSSGTMDRAVSWAKETSANGTVKNPRVSVLLILGGTVVSLDGVEGNVSYGRTEQGAQNTALRVATTMPTRVEVEAGTATQPASLEFRLPEPQPASQSSRLPSTTQAGQ